MKAAGLVFSNIHDRCIPEMTARRTMASLPFGGRYRLVDFTLSNMVNSGITKVGIVTHNNYRSLVDHIGTGKDWDLSRRSGGIMILPPFITAYDNPRANKLYSTRLEAIMGVMDFINHCDEELIVLSDSDVVCNIDLADVIDYHEQHGGDVTIVTKKVNFADSAFRNYVNVIFADDDGKVTDFIESTQMMNGEFDVSTNILVFNKSFLLSLIDTSIAHGYTDFYRQALPYCMFTSGYYVYRYEGYCSAIGSLSEYFKISMEMLDDKTRDSLFGIKERPVFTKVRNMAPTRYGEGAQISNSLIADGCVIEGEVENSILFRGVKVKKGAKIKNSILLQNTIVHENTSLNCIISDKNVVIMDDRTLSGYETMPFFISKGKIV